MRTDRPTAAQDERAIRERLQAAETLYIEDVAKHLYVSKSTLQRTLRSSGTSFSALRRRVQVQAALGYLTSGKSCAHTAERVGLSCDHLCKLVKAQADLTPKQIARAARLGARVRRWRSGVPPRAGTRLYYRRLEQWRLIEAEIAALLADLPAGHPLGSWAIKLQRSSKRPDYRRGRFRSRVQAERLREKARLAALLRQAAAWMHAQNQGHHEAAPRRAASHRAHSRV